MRTETIGLVALILIVIGGALGLSGVAVMPVYGARVRQDVAAIGQGEAMRHRR